MPKRTDTADVAAARQASHKRPAATDTPQDEELSAYELLERRSLELAEERAHGGFGTPQPPSAAVPLLYPKATAARAADDAPAQRSDKPKRRSRQAKKR